MPHDSQTIARSALRWAFILGALLVVGPLMASLAQTLRSPDGGPDATLLVSSTPAWGAVVGLVVLIGAFGFAIPAALLFGPRLALALAGFVVGWATWTTGTVDEIIRAGRGASPFVALAVEAAVYAVLGTVLALVLVALSRESPSADRSGLPTGFDDMRRSLKASISVSGLVGLLVSVAVGGFVAWAIAIEPLKGQAVFAAFLAAICGAAAGRLAAGSVREAPPAAPIVAFAAMAVLAIASPVLGAARSGSGLELLAASDAGALPPLALVLPLDWLAGALLGVPVGLAWAASLIDVEKPSGGETRPR